MKAQSRSRNGKFKQTNRRRPKTPQPAMMPPKLYREDTRKPLPRRLQFAGCRRSAKFRPSQ